jgi:hypothetical protein
LAAQIDALLAVLPPEEMLEPAIRRPLDAGAARAELERLTFEVAALSGRLDALHDERLVLPSYLEPLRLLLPLVPELADLDDQQLQRLRLGTVALVLNTEDELIVTMLRDQMAEELAGHVHVAWTRVDDGAIGCLVVFPDQHQQAVRALLGRAQVRRAELPEAFERLSIARRRREVLDDDGGSESSGDLAPQVSQVAPRSPKSSSDSTGSTVSPRHHAPSWRSAGSPGATWLTCGARSPRDSEPPSSSRTSRRLRAIPTLPC